MRHFAVRRIPAALSVALTLSSSLIPAVSTAQAPADFSAMHWREIGPVRAGRARGISGVPSQPNTFYIGFDNGGVWRSTDYGSNWLPIFDKAGTGSIGAIAVAPSDPNIIYVGTGAGIIRPDLATGDGVWKSIDGGKTWTHLGLRDSQMIAMIEVDAHDPNRLFVAALGHPYGPNAERGIFRSTDGGQTFQKVLYKDDYTSGNDVRIDPSNPQIVYATMWQQQQSFLEGQGFGGTGNGIYKSTDGGTTWNQLGGGLPSIIQANIAIAPSNPKTLYATIAGNLPAAGGRGGNNVTGVIGFFKSSDAGDHWSLVTNDPSGRQPGDPRPLARIGGGDLPTIVVDPKNEKVVYSSSTVFWRTEDAGLTWSAVRGAPGGDDYQKTWINPNNPDIILVVSDQGGVVSANRGKSWSNWYNQATAAMYHVSTDNAFPYRVCGGQQDSGSACVDSRSDDGEITFHDWHPVNIQEYGVAAPDPKNPDLVYASQRTNVSLYNRSTATTTLVGPSAEARGTEYGRNVRTMPISWSTVDPSVLFYASNVVWKSIDHAHSWTRISGDLTRGSNWTPPASTGKYAAEVKPAPAGSITAMSLSPRDIKVIWTGTDDGAINVTTNGGTSWTNVTPSAIKAWTRIFNIDAGHFDSQTAYAAANTMRIDDMNPHFWRTHDGGKTWTEINNGIAPGAVANSIREDPRKKGLLYASTDLQVWVSFDDGDHWQSLKLDMPPISVRDLMVKDDSTCQCSDLIAGTHGRGFYILDDVTPLRQMADARAALGSNSAYLYKPATGLRLRYGTNDPTPWPPELPAGENPIPGAIIDYALAKDASGVVKLDILNSTGKLVRSYSSNDLILNPDPAVDPAGYDEICKKRPAATDCGLPLYWPGPQILVSPRAGFHRFSWDMRYNTIGIDDPNAGGDEDANGAVPHHTYSSIYAPWVPPGQYTVRLTVDGKSYTQPITVKLDPRVKTPAAALTQLATMTRDTYEMAMAAYAARLQARDLVAQLDKIGGDDANKLKADIEQLAPPINGPMRRGRGGRGRGGAGADTKSLETVTNSLMNAVMATQNAEAAPTADQITAAAKARTEASEVLRQWTQIKTTGVANFNAKRKAAGQSTVAVPTIE